MVSTNNRHPRNVLTRRSFMRAASVAALGIVPAVATSANASSIQIAAEPLRYAIIGDSHIKPTDESRTFFTRRVFAYLESLDPAPTFVFHIGDLTEAGFQVEYEQYASLIPETLRDRIRHVPGNREVQWDEFGKRTFVQWYGQAPYAFDAGGVHFVALDATILLQPLGQFGQDQMDWLRAELERVGPETPVVLFFHYPIGGANYYVTDQDLLYDVISAYNVVAVHAGHLHRETVRYVNGFVQATMRAVKDGAFLHLVDREGDALALSSVEVLESSEAVVQPLATIPLARDARLPLVGQPTLEASEAEGIVRISVPASLAPGAIEVVARGWPNHLFSTGDGDKLGWLPLFPDVPGAPSTWNGSIPLADLAAGHDRIEMTGTDPDGRLYQRAYPIAIGSGNQPAIAWEHRVSPYAVHAGLVVTPGGEIAATTVGGDVVMYSISPQGPTELWRVPGEGLQSGVIGTPTVTADGTLIVGRVTGVLDALHADGSLGWQTSFDRSVLASITSVDGNGGSMLLASTGGTIHALDPADGALLWQNGSGMFTGGRPAADAGSVFASFADGTLRAFELASGREQWQVPTYASPDIYSLIARSGWAHATGLVPGQGGISARVVTATEKSATGHDAITGMAVWELPGPYMYAAPLLLDTGMLVLGATDGTVSCVDPSSGQLVWQVPLGFSIFSAAPLQYGDLVLVPGAGAQLAALHVATGDLVNRLQIGRTSLFGTPVISGNLLIAGGEDGMIRAVNLAIL